MNKDERIRQLESTLAIITLDAPEEFADKPAAYVGALEESIAQLEKELEAANQEDLIRDEIIRRLDDGWKPFFNYDDGTPMWYKCDALDPSTLRNLQSMSEQEAQFYNRAIKASREIGNADAHTD